MVLSPSLSLINNNCTNRHKPLQSLREGLFVPNTFSPRDDETPSVSSMFVILVDVMLMAGSDTSLFSSSSATVSVVTVFVLPFSRVSMI